MPACTYYVVYQADEVKGVFNTLDEIAERLNVKKSTVQFWLSPANRKRAKTKRSCIIEKVVLKNDEV